MVSPVAIAWDEDGAMYVAEMIDYPSGPTGGRVRRLEDRDGDRKYERVTVFAEGLAYPTSVLPWGGGVLVTAAPDILFFKDKDGDGRAEERRGELDRLRRGQPAAPRQRPHLGPRQLGVRRRTVGATARSAAPATPERSGSRSATRIFVSPETGEVEAVAGFSQFGLPRDDRGDRFPSWNTVPVRHVVIEERRPEPQPLPGGGVVGRVDPGHQRRRPRLLDQPPARFNRESVAFFNATAARPSTGATPSAKPTAATCSYASSPDEPCPSPGVVPVGPSYSARGVEQGREFLASTDPSFRPVNLANGPEWGPLRGRLYRELVEHPQFVPEEVRKSVEFRRWHDRGRIWKIFVSKSGRGKSSLHATSSRRSRDAGAGPPLAPSLWLVARHGPASHRRTSGSQVIPALALATDDPALALAANDVIQWGGVHALGRSMGRSLDDTNLAGS